MSHVHFDIDDWEAKANALRGKILAEALANPNADKRYILAQSHLMAASMPLRRAFLELANQGEDSQLLNAAIGMVLAGCLEFATCMLEADGQQVLYSRFFSSLERMRNGGVGFASGAIEVARVEGGRA